MNKRLNLRPEKIVNITFDFVKTRILSTAVDLELFTHMSRGTSSLPELANKIKVDERKLEIIINPLCAMGFLKKDSGRLKLTPIAKVFLVKGRRMYYGDYVKHIDLSWQSWSKLTEVVKTGKPSLATGQEAKGGFNYYEELVPLIFPTSLLVAQGAVKVLGIGQNLKKLKVLEIASGASPWGIAIIQQDRTSTIDAVDDAKILEVTKNYTKKYGVQDRYNYIPGNIEKADFGRDLYDLAILSYICHGIGAEKSKDLFKRVHRALKEKGKIIICEIIPDENREKDLFPLLFAVNMIIHTKDGNTFTLNEYEVWLKEAGFSNVSTLDIPATSPLIISTK